MDWGFFFLSYLRFPGSGGHVFYLPLAFSLRSVLGMWAVSYHIFPSRSWEVKHVFVTLQGYVCVWAVAFHILPVLFWEWEGGVGHVFPPPFPIPIPPNSLFRDFGLSHLTFLSFSLPVLYGTFLRGRQPHQG